MDRSRPLQAGQFDDGARYGLCQIYCQIYCQAAARHVSRPYARSEDAAVTDGTDTDGHLGTGWAIPGGPSCVIWTGRPAGMVVWTEAGQST
jgi:hypothetical protein